MEDLGERVNFWYDGNTGSVVTGLTYTTTYDGRGRPLTLVDNFTNANGQPAPRTWANNVQYTASGLLPVHRKWRARQAARNDIDADEAGTVEIFQILFDHIPIRTVQLQSCARNRIQFHEP